MHGFTDLLETSLLARAWSPFDPLENPSSDIVLELQLAQLILAAGSVHTFVSRSSNLLSPRRISSSLCNVFARSVSLVPPFLNALLSFLDGDLRSSPAVVSAAFS